MPEDNPNVEGIPKGSELVRSVPQVSEPFGSIPQDTEVFRSFPHPAEGPGNVAQHAERKSNHTLTVREVARMFEAAGVARTERSITNWCQPNRTGIARLDSYYDPNDRRYYIAPESVERAIQEEQSKAARPGDQPSPVQPQTSPAIAAGEPRREVGTAPDEKSVEVRTLQQENLDLKITNRAKDIFIEQLRKEREDFAQERQDYVQKLMTFNHRLGTLESQLLQLSEPRGNTAQSKLNPISEVDDSNARAACYVSPSGDL